MVNYNNGKIYKIESHLGDKIYVGSTTKEYLSQRMTAHRGDYGKWKQGKHSNVSSYELFEEYGVENCNIVLLELFPCSSKDELIAKETHYIRTLKCVNKVIPGRTHEEYKEENKDKIKEQQKKYDEARKEQKKQYRQDNKEKMKEYKKKYVEDNKEKIKEQTKLYSEKTKAIKTQSFNCECGCIIQLCEKSRHQRTKKHAALMPAGVY